MYRSLLSPGTAVSVSPHKAAAAAAAAAAAIRTVTSSRNAQVHLENDHGSPTADGLHDLVLLHQAGTSCKSAFFASVGNWAEGSTHRCIDEGRIAKASAPVAEV